MGDPRRLFDAQDIEAAALYAKRVAADTGDLYPVLVDTAGNLCVNMTVGTVSLSSTASVITNAVGNPVNVLPTTTASTITNAAGNPIPVTGNVNISSATLGTVTVSGSVSLTSTLTTAHISPSASVATVHFSPSASVTTAHISPSASVVTVHISPSASAATVSLSNTNVTVNVGRVLTGCTVSINATTGTVTTAGTNRLKIYAISITTTATTSAVATFVNGTYGGMVLWRAVLQAPSGANAGLNLAVTPPAFLFATGSAQLLRLNLSAAIPVECAVSYFDEA